ncbi:eCIS core domain-containing protein [Cellulomonas xylanilytica]|uniref:eCIS core domain-containing protein n=1 Tax=Cellulomonas xylanilytica TaxID=233583 RepID=A0A510V7Z9_9CELL|nr:DUF4157 domain-containing protein [Cellulomonas xylanilytica]GEK22984.1 hypothetical protein CXY01_35040 [Cellulomonas xylanilytica]
MPAEHDRTTLERARERVAVQGAPAVRTVAVAPVAVHGLATGVQRRSTGDDPLGGTTVAPEIGTALRRRQGGGRPLEAEHADRMGAAMGVDFSGVRIHDDSEADTIARSVQATAFTAGSDVYFTRGTYTPGTSGGDHLLAHELAHVAQGGAPTASAQGPVIGSANDPAEAAADSLADSAVRRLQRQTARVSAASAPAAAEAPGEALAPLRRQAEQAGTVRRWNPFKALFGGKKKKLSTTTPVPSPVTTPVVPQVAVPQVAVPQVAVPQVVVPPTKPAKPPRSPKPLPKVPVPQVADASSTTTPVTTPEPVSPTSAVADPVVATVADPVVATVADPVVATVADPVVETVADPVATAVVDPAATTVVDPVADPVATTVADPSVVPTDATASTALVAPTATVPVVATPEVVTPPAQKPAKERFEAACDPQTAPADKGVARTRMDALRVIINGFSGAEKKAISTDPDAMAKGRAHLGDLYYMSLLAAVDTNVMKTDDVDATKKTKHHLTGAEADEFIKTNIEDYPHLKPFIEAAVGAGKKGEGYVASISPEDWAIVYGVEFPHDSQEEQEDTNAYASTKNADGPAILHADRGTPSTAIHESMHRYAPDDVLDTFGFDLNEGITEYFTRILTNQKAQPAKDGGPERTNYPGQVAFVREMVRILGATKVEQETVLAQIYFEGKLALFKTKFKEAHAAKTSTLTEAELDDAWSSFKGFVENGDWSDARTKLPAP